MIIIPNYYSNVNSGEFNKFSMVKSNNIWQSATKLLYIVEGSSTIYKYILDAIRVGHLLSRCR